MRKIVVAIAHVSGDSNLELTTNDALEAQQFLAEKDHEGSSVGFSLVLEDAEEVHEVLHALRESDLRRGRNA